MGWEFKGAPGVFNPHLIDALREYRSLSQAASTGKKVSQAALNSRLEQIQRNIGMLPRIADEDRPAVQQAGSRLEQPLIDMLYSKQAQRNSMYTARDLEYMPPVRVAPGLVITGKPDVIEKNVEGMPSGIKDIKTAYRPSSLSMSDFLQGGKAVPGSFYNRMMQYGQSTQSVYPTAFGLKEMTYKGFAFGDPTRARAQDYLAKMDVTAAGISIPEGRRRAFEAYSTLEQLGPDYVHAFMDKSSRSWYNQAFKPRAAWEREAGIQYGLVTDSPLTPMERDLLWGESFEKRALARQSDVERRKEGGKTIFSIPDNPLNLNTDPKQKKAVVKIRRPNQFKVKEYDNLKKEEDLDIEELMGAKAGPEQVASELGGYLDFDPSNPKNNKGFSLDTEGKGIKEKVFGMSGKSTSKGAGSGEQTELGTLPSGEKVLPSVYKAFSHYSSARGKGDERGADLWSGYKDITSFERLWDLESFDYFKKKQKRAVFGALKSGDYESAEVYAGTQDINELEGAILGVAKASRDAKDALSEQAAIERRHNKGLSMAANIKPYDWTRWYQTTNEAWGNVKQASSWMPSWLTAPAGRIGDALMQQYGADVSQKKGIYDAIMKGAVPLGAAVGSFFGVPGMAVGGAIGGVVSAGSQVIGNWKEGEIRAGGLRISSMLNMIGGVFEIGKAAIMGITSLVNLIKIPLRILSRGFKILAPTVLGVLAVLTHTMTAGLKSMSNLGNPLSSLTQSNYGSYQGSEFADIMSGMSKGTTSGAVQNLASLRAGFFNMGRFNTDQLIDATMMGQFGAIFNNNAGNTYEDYGNIITSMAKQMSSQNPASRQKSMYFLEHFDKTMASQVERLLGHYDLGGNLSFQEYNDPRTYGIQKREISDPERERFRIAQMGYQSLQSSMDVSKMRIAIKLWDDFGKGAMAWIDGLYEAVARGDSWREIAAYVGRGLKALWNATLGPIAESIVANFGSKLDALLDVIDEKAPGMFMAITSVFPKISDFIIDVFYDMGQKIWSIFDRLLNTLGSIQIDPAGIRAFLTNKGTFADVLKVTKPPVGYIYDIMKATTGNAQALERPLPLPDTLRRLRMNQEKYLSLPQTSLWTDANINGEETGFSFFEGGKYARTESGDSGDGARLKALGDLKTDPRLASFDLWEAAAKSSTGIPNTYGALTEYNVLNRMKIALLADENLTIHDALKALELYAKNTGKVSLSSIEAMNDYFYSSISDEPKPAGVSDTLNEIFNADDKEELKARVREGMGNLFTEENFSRGVSGATDMARTMIDIVVRLEDSEGKLLLEEMLKGLGEGAEKTVEAAFKAFGGMSDRVKHLSHLTWDRAAQKALRNQASQSQR